MTAGLYALIGAADQPVAVLVIGAITAAFVGFGGIITAFVQLRKAKTELLTQQQAHELAMETLKRDLEAGRIADRRASKDDTQRIIDRLRVELDRAWTRIDVLEVEIAGARDEIVEWRGKCESCLQRLTEVERNS